MNVPEDLRYTKDHEWVRIEDDTAVIGITDYAQGELGDIVYVEPPVFGESITQFETCGSIEAVKAVSDLYAPVSGEVIDVNDALESDPQLINQGAFGEGWIFKVKFSDPAEIENLLTAEDYKAMLV
ncbi:glycine cleavage system protein GcvH [candidate division KSB1 bacterium]|nr:glycine cleavage system protein GcvH [candidate division KSB1 bacterium]